MSKVERLIYRAILIMTFMICLTFLVRHSHDTFVTGLQLCVLAAVTARGLCKS